MSNLVKYYFENQTDKEFQDFYNEILSVEIKNRIIEKLFVLTNGNMVTKLARAYMFRLFSKLFSNYFMLLMCVFYYKFFQIQ